MSQREWKYLLLPVAVATALFVPSIGQRILYHSDEARFALLARGMVEGGHWLVPHLGGEAHMEKPPPLRLGHTRRSLSLRGWIKNSSWPGFSR